MKKVIFYLFLLSTGITKAQNTQKLSNAYLGIMLHDGNSLGGSFAVSLGINQFIGLGAGVDVTTKDKSILAPVYADLRVKYPFSIVKPYIVGQIGIPVYSNSNPTEFTDITGAPVPGLTQKGKIFYGGGLGAFYKVSKVGVFIQGVFRAYKYQLKDKDGQDANVNGKSIPPIKENNIEIIIGIVI